MELVLSAIVFLFMTAVAGALWRNRTIVYGTTGGLCLVLSVIALVRLLAAVGPDDLTLPFGLPWMGAHLRIDSLSTLFLLVINVTGATASLFGWGYEGAHEEPEAGPVLPLYPLFLAGMNLVVVADDAFVFLVAWEFMSLASWLLVLSTHREDGTMPAARVYLIMASFGSACLILAFGLLAAGAGDYTFTAFRLAGPTGWTATAVVLLVLAGAGSKAGIVPLHVWLPLAHPAAPSHVSALMSGVMTKVAIYAVIRVLFDLLPEPDWWWGGLIMGLGALTALGGILQAMGQDDVKRLLAYSTVENIGVILIGLGLALVFKASDAGPVYALALLAALLHVVNHSLFKSLLFFGAGAVMTATGSRDLNALGGLIRVLPTTAALMLVGAMAIAALPPLNGFVSEWLLFQAILNGPHLAEWPLKVGTAVVGAAAALAAALAAACFVRFYGVAFLGRVRSQAARSAQEVGTAMRAAMAIPAGLCILIGIVPMPFVHLLRGVIERFAGVHGFAPETARSWFQLSPTAALGNVYNATVLVIVVLVFAVVVVLTIHRFASAKVRHSIAWGCGHEEADPAGVTQYTPSSMAQPIRRAIGSAVFATREAVDMPDPLETRPARFELVIRDPAWAYFYDPLVRLVAAATGRLDRLQGLSIRRHLTLMFIAVVVLLVVVAVVG